MNLLILVSLSLLVTVLLWVALKFRNMDCDWATYFLEINREYFKNRIVWVTGASSGIGKALAFELASNGAHLVISARREAVLREIAKKIESTNDGCKVMVLAMDCCEKDSQYYIDKYAQIVKYFNGDTVDILINNAGFTQRCLFTDMDLKHSSDMIQCNLMTPIFLTKICLSAMIDKKFGHICGISSVVDKMRPVTRTVYGASKSGLTAFDKCLNGEVSEHNIGVTTVLPGPTQTDVDIAAAGKRGQMHEKRDTLIVNGMTPQRCADRICAAISNRTITETWISIQPILTLLYVIDYTPDWLVNKLKQKLQIGLLRSSGYVQ